MLDLIVHNSRITPLHFVGSISVPFTRNRQEPVIEYFYRLTTAGCKLADALVAAFGTNANIEEDTNVQRSNGQNLSTCCCWMLFIATKGCNPVRSSQNDIANIIKTVSGGTVTNENQMYNLLTNNACSVPIQANIIARSITKLSGKTRKRICMSMNGHKSIKLIAGVNDNVLNNVSPAKRDVINGIKTAFEGKVNLKLITCMRWDDFEFNSREACKEVLVCYDQADLGEDTLVKVIGRDPGRRDALIREVNELRGSNRDKVSELSKITGRLQDMANDFMVIDDEPAAVGNLQQGFV